MASLESNDSLSDFNTFTAHSAQPDGGCGQDIKDDTTASCSPTSSEKSISLQKPDLNSVDLHKLCRTCKLDKIQKVVRGIDPHVLRTRLSTQRGVFGYTALHEAVANKNSGILEFLLRQTGTASIINCTAKSNYTPLHMAASSGLVDSVRVLLKHNADINFTDEFGRTPRAVARLSSRHEAEKLLFSEELIQELEQNEDGGKFTSWLYDKNNQDLLDSKCLERALLVAVRKDYNGIIGMLVEKGAKNIDASLQLAFSENKPKAGAILLLIKAAKEGDADTVKSLYKEQGSRINQCERDERFKDVQEVLLNGEVSMTVPIRIAGRSGHKLVRELLLMKSNVNNTDKASYVKWSGLELQQLEVAWLRKISWVKLLIIPSNGFRKLPIEMETYLKKVVEINLQNNVLASIPQCLLQLPNLKKLNLSYNKLQEIPRLTQWSPSLQSLDLSHNHLSSINPKDIFAPALCSLNLSRNKLHSVPLCVCGFTALQSLNLGKNPDIMILPPEMGQLSNIFELNLNGLNDISDPPKNIQKDPKSCIKYLNKQWRCTQKYYKMKLMLVGYANRGKTTLVARLQGRICGDESTVGVDIREWSYRASFNRPKFHFSIWDFGGQEEYYATHQCFLSQKSLYLLLFNLMHGREGVRELLPWLSNLASRVPQSCVIIIGSHLDEIRDESALKEILTLVSTTVQPFRNKLQIVDVITVGLKNNIKNVNLLKNAIYNHATNYKDNAGKAIMGRDIPASYHALDRQLQKLQEEVRHGDREPVMHLEEFKAMVYDMKLKDIQDDEELKIATLFLSDIGSLLHYDDRRHDLHELYFIDPRWLCDMMATIITVKERNSFIQDGILHKKYLPFLFKERKFLERYFNQYLMLLDQFEIAIPLSENYILIPSMLPGKLPDELIKDDQREPLHSRMISFNSGNTPSGFWSRLLSRVMHHVPKVAYVLHTAKSTTIESSIHNDPQLTYSFSENNSQNSQSQADPKSSSKRSNSLPQETRVYGKESSLRSIVFEESNTLLRCWRTGLHYKDTDLTFTIESLSHSKYSHMDDGVQIAVSNNTQGKKMMCRLTDLVVQLVSEWYPGLQDKKAYGPSGLEQRVPCFECVRQGEAEPYEFSVQDCLAKYKSQHSTIRCEKFHNNHKSDHTIPFSDIIPDSLLEDIDSEFILEAEEIDYQEDEASTLGRGSYGKVYRGICRGKAVAVKKFIAKSNNEAYSELRLEAKLLEHLHHPCLVCLVGVSTLQKVLVLEEAPLKSLEHSLTDQENSKNKEKFIHRLTIFRIAAQVAAALRFLHTQGIIFRDLKASNVLVWSLDPDSLCHCKVTDFSIATHIPLTGTRGTFGTEGFMAPEVLSHCSIYDEKADIFSFSMFLYQLITRRCPTGYHPLQGHRPKFNDIDSATTAYHYLTQLMIECWNENPNNRPSTEEIIKRLSSSSMQTVMCVATIKTQPSLRQGVIISPADFAKAGYINKHDELWICCDGLDGMEVSVYNTHTMVNILNQPYFRDNQFNCMALCGGHMWVCSRAGVDYGVIDIVNIDTHKSVHSIHMNNVFISCITATEEAVYVGTNKGHCFSFPRYSDTTGRTGALKNKSKQISHNPIKGMASTEEYLWVSQANSIVLISYNDLEIHGQLYRDEEADKFIGELTLANDKRTVWSALIGNTLVSAWDTHNRSFLLNICVQNYIDRFPTKLENQDLIITAMVPVLDTVWVGTASGHIMIFYNQELLAWYEPYKQFVSFLCCSSITPDPCGKEKCIVASGGSELSNNMDNIQGRDEDEKMSSSSENFVVLWEAYEAKTVRQVRMIEDNAPGYLENYTTVRKMIHDGQFKDGTNILEKN